MCVLKTAKKKEQGLEESVKFGGSQGYISGIIFLLACHLVEALTSPVMEFGRELGISKSNKLLLKLKLGLCLGWGW